MILTYGQYPNITPRNKKSEWGKVQIWKKLIWNPRQTNKEHKNEQALLPVCLEQTMDQDVIQIDNNTETLVMTTEQDRFSEGCGYPKR